MSDAFLFLVIKCPECGGKFKKNDLKLLKVNQKIECKYCGSLLLINNRGVLRTLTIDEETIQEEFEEETVEENNYGHTSYDFPREEVVGTWENIGNNFSIWNFNSKAFNMLFYSIIIATIIFGDFAPIFPEFMKLFPDHASYSVFSLIIAFVFVITMMSRGGTVTIMAMIKLLFLGIFTIIARSGPESMVLFMFWMTLAPLYFVTFGAYLISRWNEGFKKEKSKSVVQSSMKKVRKMLGEML